MSKVFKVVATVAGIAAVFLPPPFREIAQGVAIVASIGAQVTQKQTRPPATGNTSQILIGSNMPQPYSMGRTYVGGNMLHDVGYGGTVADVPNPYRSMVLAWSGSGPAEEIEAFQADFETVAFAGAAATGYYGGFMWLDTQLGATPEGSALSGPHGAIPDWGASHKLSGYAAGLVTMKFDKKGKVYASGVPQFGAIGKWVKAYDPRLDSTYPGGSGAHRFDDETTWAWAENPALHAIAYARGRYHNGKKVFGCGFPEDAIDLAAFVALANICNANGWTIGGTIYEPGSRWDNLKRILETAAAEPIFVGARLSVKYSAPKTSLDTINADDLADGEYIVPAMKAWRGRKNGLIPKYRSEAHKWEMVQSDLISVGTYVTEDGEEKEEEYPLELVQEKDQAAQLAAYKLVNGREFGPIVLPLKPRLREYLPGEALTGGADLAELGLAGQLMVITGRKIDPATAIVELTLESETAAKHPFALGQTGTAPPTPTITTGEDMDAVAARDPHLRGAYGGGETYYLDDIVIDQAMSWRYIDATPGSGHAPPTLPTNANAYWEAMSPASLDELDAVSAAYLDILIGDAAAAADDNVFTIREKIDTILPAAAELGARYDRLVSRATALGVSTSAATNARTGLVTTYLGALSPVWNDVGQDTILAVGATGDLDFPTNWTAFGATMAANGIYTKVEDDSAAAFEFIYRVFSGLAANQQWTVAIRVKKDAVAKTTRTPMLRLQANNGTFKQWDLQFATDTGEIVLLTSTGGAPNDYNVQPLNENEWLVWITGTTAGGTTQVQVEYYPAVGTNAGYSATPTGYEDVADAVLVNSDLKKVGRNAFRYYLRAYQAALDDLDKAISEAAPNVEVPGSIAIDANSGGTTTTTLPLTARCKCWIGAVDRSPDAGFSLGTLPAGISATINNTASHADRGVITVTFADGPGNLIVNCTPPGFAEQSRQVPVTRTVAVATSPGGAGAIYVSDGTFPNVSSGTLADVSDVMTIRSTAGGTLIFSANIRHLPSSGSSANVMGIKARIRTTAGPGAWGDVAAEITGSANGTDAETGQPTKGVVTIADTTKTGLIASTDYDVVLQGRRFSGSDTLVVSNSSFVVRQS